MKKYLLYTLFFLVLFLGGCQHPMNQEESAASLMPTDESESFPPADNARIPSFIVDGVTYVLAENKLDELNIDVKEEDYAGRITSAISLSEVPTENGQSNYAPVGTPYIQYEDGFYEAGYAILIGETWTFFRDSRKEFKQYAIKVDGMLYIFTGFYVHPAKTGEEDYAGRIASAVNASEWPAEDGQTNNKTYIDALYVKYEYGYALLSDGKWLFFGVRGNAPENFDPYLMMP